MSRLEKLHANLIVTVAQAILVPKSRWLVAVKLPES